jgi:hypothetical protein
MWRCVHGRCRSNTCQAEEMEQFSPVPISMNYRNHIDTNVQIFKVLSLSEIPTLIPFNINSVF